MVLVVVVMVVVVVEADTVELVTYSSFKQKTSFHHLQKQKQRKISIVLSENEKKKHFSSPTLCRFGSKLKQRAGVVLGSISESTCMLQQDTAGFSPL